MLALAIDRAQDWDELKEQELILYLRNTTGAPLKASQIQTGSVQYMTHYWNIG